ncbi:MAG: hypothetical protein JWN78_1303 [Bacteroidota bacterium]|nr:hypothetical protein [Bacteroidota bacterium]
MKHLSKLTISLGVLFSYLFYRQNIGLNALIFSMMLIFLSFRHPGSLKKKTGIICGGSALLAGLFVYLNNSTLSIIAWYISLMSLLSFKDEGNFTIPTYVFTYIINLLSLPFVFLYKRIFSPKKEISDQETNDPTDKINKIWGYVVVIIVVCIFFFVYQKSNPLFYQYTKDMNLGDIDFGFIFFSILGCLLISVYAYDTAVKILFWIENKQENTIPAPGSFNASPPKYKIQTIGLLFIMLNGMLIFINLLDVNYLYLAHALPKGITHAQFVHNGVGILIFSIILGTSIICYLFRGKLNFIDENKTIKILVYVWILQNVFMVISTVIRNGLYVVSYGLTGKRIGVYYYLAFAIIGLMLVAFKIKKQKTIYFLYAANTWVWYIVLIISSSISWENLIYKNQADRFLKTGKIDYKYVSHFTNTNLPELVALFKIGKAWNCDSELSYSEFSCDDYMRVNEKLVLFLDKYKNTQWQSQNINDTRTYQQLLALNAAHQFDSISLVNITYYNYQTDLIKLLSCLTNIRKIEVPDTAELENLYLLKNTEKVMWYGTDVNQLKYFVKMSNLKELDLPNFSNTDIQTFEAFLPNVTITRNR